MFDATQPGAPLALDGVWLTLPSAAGPVEILRGLDFSVEAGERVAVVGPSGSGKSTLIAIGAGLERPTKGKVRLLGQELSQLDEDGRARLRRGRVSLVFQAFHLLPNMTAEENVAAPLEIAGAKGGGKTAREWLDRVGLAPRRTHYPHQLSGGEQQRVALARALATRPTLLFADEPTGNLDHDNARHVADLIFELSAETGAALVLVTHDEALAARADRIARMAAGRVEGVIPLSFRFAGRELRSGVRGFRIFLACLALGVAAIAAAGSTAEAFRQGLASQAAQILGGDLAVGVKQREFAPKERAALEKLGPVSYAVASRAMAQAPSGARRLVELRGVSAGYPLVGEVELSGGMRLADALQPAGDAAGVVVEQPLLDRLGLKLGDQFLVGNVPVVARAVLLGEPDRLSRGFALGPRVLGRIQMVRDGGFLGPGLPFGETARIALRPGVTLEAAKRAITRALPAGSFRVRDRNEAAPGFSRLIDQLEYFLGFIGLSSLIAGGLGVSGAVGAYLEARKPSIATLKALGADGALARNVYLIQIAVLASLEVAIGIVVGGAAPLILGNLVKKDLPVPALFALYPAPLAKAALFGLLSAAAFSLAPLGRARATPPAALFRQELAGRLGFGPELVGAVLAAAALATLAIFTAPTRLSALIMIGGVAAAFVVLFLIGLAAAWAAGRLRALTSGPLRIGLANLAGPHSAARTAAPAIGLGVGLLAAVVLIQSSLIAEVTVTAPTAAPALVFIEIPGDKGPAFDAAVAQGFGRGLTPKDYMRFPFATGRITELKGHPVDKAKIGPAGQWAFDADISLSAIGAEPEGSGIVSGRWWPANYAGPPLVAMEDDLAKAAGLKIGDEVTIATLGREFQARLAATRKVDFGGFGPDFSLVLDAAALAGANPRQVAIAKATPAEEVRVTRALGASFPGVDVISVREQLQAATQLFDRVTLAVRAAAAVAGLAGLLVLAGAIAAGARARAKEAATLKVLGAARWQILAAYGIEYGAVGAVAGLAGVALGFAAAWPVVVKVFEATWSVDWTGAIGLIAGAAAITGAGGLIAALHALAMRPAPVLRAE